MASHDRGRRLLGAALAFILLALILNVARPAAVWQLIRNTDPVGLVPAAAMATLALLFRGLRLRLLLPAGSLRLVTATLVAAAAQAAALFVPARAGEFALPLLLRRVTGCDLATGLGTLLAARTLDLAALGTWAGVAILAIWGLGQPLALMAALLLLVPPLLLPATLASADWLAVRTLAPRGPTGRRWTRRVRRIRRAVSGLRSRPIALAGAVSASLAMWAALWSLAWYLLVAMGYRWPPMEVVAGSAVASFANLLPFNLVGNLGTLEAGWTAAFTALGVPVEVAAATGFASHLWALVYAAIFGTVAWGALALGHPRETSDESMR
jgi:uncharacterized protein (TIRG00374 family)